MRLDTALLRTLIGSLATGCVLTILTQSLSGQEAPVRRDLDPHAVSTYFDTMSVPQDPNVVRAMLDEIDEVCTQRIRSRCRPGVDLLLRFFGGSYRDDLPDFIVHLEGDDGERLRANQPVLLFNRRNTPYLQGVQHIYLLIFSDREVPLSARLTTIQEKEANPFAGVLSVAGLGDAGATAPSISAEDASIEVSWTRLGNPEVSDPIYLGLGRLPIRSDVVARLTLIPDDYEQVSFQAVTAHLSNSHSGATAFAGGLAATFDIDDTLLAEETSDPAFNGYVLAKFYLPGQRPLLDVRPNKRSLYQRSTAFVFGTNVTNDAFSELVIGLSFGHLWGKAGIVVAANWVSTDDGDREAKGMLGVDFTF